MADVSRMPCAYRNGYHHGYTGQAPLQPASTSELLTAAMRGDAPPEPAFAWAFASNDYKRGYEAGLNDAFWIMERIKHPNREAMRIERQALFNALPWNAALTTPA